MNRLSAFLTIFLTSFLMSYAAHAQRPESVQENLIVSAVQKYNEGNYEAARATLSNLLQNDSRNDAAWYYLALVSLAENDLVDAEDYLKLALEIDPRNFWYRYRLAGIYAVTSRHELTIDIYENLLKDFPKKSDLYFDLVELYSAQNEYDKALATLDEIQTVLGDSESIAVYRFNLLRRLNRVEDAYASLEEYNRKYSSPYILSTLADYEISMYNDSTALAYYNEALDLVPDYSPALLGKAEVLRMTRQYDEYFNTLYRFVDGTDTPVPGKTDYLMAVIQRTDPKFIRTFMPQLDTTMTKLLTVHPTDSSALHTAGAYYYSTGRLDRAKSCFEITARIYPESFSASASLVEFLMYAQMWQELSDEGRLAFERFPQEPAFLEMAGVGDYNLGDYEKVLQSCEMILDVAPRDSSKTLRSWSTMGDVYFLLGDKAKAYKAYEKALKINPDYVYVLNNYAYYLSLEKKSLKKAHKMSSRTIELEPDNATYLDTFGWILFLEGKSVEAKQIFKRAMLYGGKESAVILDHYAEVLYALKEYDMAFVYWNLARQRNNGDIPDLEDKINIRKAAVGR
jgi:tetratricopeptide (TPR) repeat protein